MRRLPACRTCTASPAAEGEAFDGTLTPPMRSRVDAAKTLLTSRRVAAAADGASGDREGRGNLGGLRPVRGARRGAADGIGRLVYGKACGGPQCVL